MSNAEQHYAFKELDKQRVVSFEITAELYNQLYSRYTTLKCPLYLFFYFLFIYLNVEMHWMGITYKIEQIVIHYQKK